MEHAREGRFCRIELTATDLERQTRFYEAVFGWTHRDMPAEDGPSHRLFLLDGSVVAEATTAGGTVTSSAWNVLIATADAERIARRAEELGGQVTVGVTGSERGGRLVGVQDPSEALAFFWEPGDYHGAEAFGEPGTFVWADLMTRYPEAAIAFYERLLDWEIVPDAGADRAYWEILVDGDPQGSILPIGAQLPSEVAPHWLVYFGSEDADRTLDAIREYGGATEMEPLRAAERCTFCVASDPAGARFAVMEPLDRG